MEQIDVILNTVIQLEFGEMKAKKTNEIVTLNNVHKYPEILKSLKDLVKKESLTGKDFYQKLEKIAKEINFKNLDLHLSNLKKFCTQNFD